MDWFGSWRWKWLDGDGTVLREGAGKNLLHNTGQQFILQNAFGPLTDNLTVLCEDCSYTTATNTLADVDTANTAFATVIIGDKIYVAGGTDNEATPGLYTVASNADNDTVTTTEEVQAGNVAGGIVVLVGRKFAMGLDNRATLVGGDVAATAKAAEESAGGYARVSLDPHNSALWTIALDSDYDDYTAVSATCTFTASDALWQANKNLFIMAHTGTLAAPANEVLIASISLGDPITLGDTQNFTAQYTARVKETA